MICPSVNSLFLRANGSLSCWDDYGSRKEILKFDESKNYADEVYLGKHFSEIRNKIKNNELPFPDYCKKCRCMDLGIPYHFNHKVIEVLHIEPSLYCNLNCQACFSEYQRNNIYKDEHYLSKDILHKILTDFKNSNIEVRNITFAGMGEPFCNIHIQLLIDVCHNIYPNSHKEIITNANFDYSSNYFSSKINRVIFSIDGTNNENYSKYRKNGNFCTAFNFMENYCKESNEKHSNVFKIWKYILFDYNDSTENIYSAIKMAVEINIDELQFIITSTGPKSKKIKNSDELISIISKFNKNIPIDISILPSRWYFLLKKIKSTLRHSFLFPFLSAAFKIIFKKNYSNIITGKNINSKLLVSCSYATPNKLDIKNGNKLVKNLIEHKQFDKAKDIEQYINNKRIKF